MKPISAQNSWIRTKDGERICQRLYAPERPNQSVVIIGPSATSNQSFYKAFAQYLIRHHYRVVTFDYRGRGLSRNKPLSGYYATLSQWGLFDLDAVILHVKNKFPHSEIIYIGHQISGEIAGMAPSFQFVNRMILVGSGVSSRQFWHWSSRVQVSLLTCLQPLFRLLDRWIPGAEQRLMQYLPLEVVRIWTSGNPTNDSIFEALTEKNHAQFQQPLLAYSFSDDRTVTKKAVAALLKHFTNAPVEWKHVLAQSTPLRRVGNLGFFQEEIASTLWAELVAWLNDRRLA